MTITTDSTAAIVAGMLVENTGRHMLDSGGAYGRAWERNQANAGTDPVAYFESRPEATWSYGAPTLDVFHFVTKACDYAPTLDRAWRTFVRTGPRDRYYNAYGTAEEFVQALIDKGWADPNAEWPCTTINTYNGEDCLSQVLQYTLFQLTDACPWQDDARWTDYRVLLSIHGGCDVRGGYTDCRAFITDPWGETSLLLNQQAYASCDNGHAFYTDDAGYHWYDAQDEGRTVVPADDHGDTPPVCSCGAALTPYIQ